MQLSRTHEQEHPITPNSGIRALRITGLDSITEFEGEKNKRYRKKGQIRKSKNKIK